MLPSMLRTYAGQLWCGLLFGLVMVLCISNLSAAPLDGFSATTNVTLILDYNRIIRGEWENAHDGDEIMPGRVTLSGGTGINPGSSNKIMLYGDRTDPLYPGEGDWYMTPRPVNYFVTPTEVEILYDFPYGPACTTYHTGLWLQIYGYRAAINLDGGGSASGSDTLGIY